MRLMVNGRHETRPDICSVATLVAEITDAHRGGRGRRERLGRPAFHLGAGRSRRRGTRSEVLTAAQGG